MANALSDSYVDDGGSETEAPEQEPRETEATERESEPETPVEPPKLVKTNRRGGAQAAREALAGELKGLRDTIERQQRENAEASARYQREVAELRGNFQGYMSQQRQQTERPPEPALPDPEKLLEEANAALDRKDFAGYQKKYAESIRAGMMREIAPRFQQQTQAPQPQINPMLQIVASQYGDVVGNRAAFELVQAHDRILAGEGVPEGPERWKLAFEEGRRYLASKAKGGQQRFSQGSRAVLSSQVPTDRSAPRGERAPGETGIRLSAEELKTAKKYRMTPEEYAAELAELHPERVEKD